MLSGQGMALYRGDNPRRKGRVWKGAVTPERLFQQWTSWNPGFTVSLNPFWSGLLFSEWQGLKEEHEGWLRLWNDLHGYRDLGSPAWKRGGMIENSKVLAPWRRIDYSFVPSSTRMMGHKETRLKTNVKKWFLKWQVGTNFIAERHCGCNNFTWV